jgi:ParB-like chromosome segregation protein Spo0J
METTVIEYVDPKDLKNHPLNIEIYGDVADEEFVDSCSNGIIEPLVVLADNTIISGHRRMQAARIHQHDTVPVIYRHDLTEDLEIEETLLLANKQRTKTNEQKAREYKKLRQIEKARASKRRTDGTIVPKGDHGRSKSKAAKAVGLNEKTADKAEEVVDKIDKAKADGQSEEAEQLTETLNQNISKAHRRVKRKPRRVVKKAAIPKGLQPVFELGSDFQSVISKLGKILKSVDEMADFSGGERIPVTTITVDINNVVEALKASKPHAICPLCGGSKCDTCTGLGWVHKDLYNGIPMEQKTGATA